MSKPFWETHLNPNEYFPLKGKLGSPTEGAKPVKLAGDLLAALAALAAAAAAMFFLYASCVPLFIGADSAQLEVDLFNREPGQDIFWTLVEGLPPDTPPSDPLDSGYLEEDSETLTLTRLEPNTEYTIVFMTPGPDGQLQIIHTFTFKTDGYGNPPPPPPPSDSGEEAGEEAPPATQEDNDPPETQATETSEPTSPTETTKATEPETPPTKPAGGGMGGGGGENPPAKDQGSLEHDEHRTLNIILSDLPVADTVPVTVFIGAYTAGDYAFRITDVEMTADGNDLTEADYRNLQWSAVPGGLQGTFDLLLDPAWTAKGYTTLSVLIKGANYADDGTMVGEKTSTSVTGQINLVPGYDVEITSPVGQSVQGLTCTSAELSADSLDGTRLTGVVPGQTVYVSLYLEGAAAKDFTLTADYPNTVGMVPQTGYGNGAVTAGKEYAFLFYQFTMPARNVTASDIRFTLKEEGASGFSLFAAPAPAPAPVISGGSNSVGPISITQEVHGLLCTQATFNTGTIPSGAQLADVSAGETVYLEILLQGVAQKSFQLSAAFAPGPKITDLQVMNQDAVSMLDTDAYLRIRFTMPDESVTAEDLGFLGFVTY